MKLKLINSTVSYAGQEGECLSMFVCVCVFRGKGDVKLLSVSAAMGGPVSRCMLVR